MSAVTTSPPPLTASMAPLANHARVVLPYAQQYNKVSGAQNTFGTTDTIVYLNDIFAPTNESPHQPYGHDELVALYSYYKVISVKLRVTAIPAGNSETHCLAARLVPPGISSGIAGTTVSASIERPGTKYTMTNIYKGNSSVAFDVPLHLAVGVSQQQYAADVSEFAAATGASPSKRPSIGFHVAGLSGANVTLYTILQVEYTVDFWGRKTLTQS